MRMTLVIAALLAGVPAAQAAADDFEILSSNVAVLKPGDKFEKGAKLNLPDGAKVTYIDRTGGAAQMRECGGRYEGPIELCIAKPSGPARTAPGATRGIIRQ